MTDRDRPISPLRRRMTFLRPPKRASRRRVEDMEVRAFTACTQRGYIAAVSNFTAFLGRAPDQADKEDLRRFQHHMRMQGASAANMNMAVSALRFFFGVTLGRGDAEVGMTTVRLPQRLPVILSPAEVARLLDHAPGLKARAALGLAYGAGLGAKASGLPRGDGYRLRAPGDPHRRTLRRPDPRDPEDHQTRASQTATVKSP